MKTIPFEGRDQWLLARKGKITGTSDITNCYDIPKKDLMKQLDLMKIVYKKADTKEVLQSLLPEEVVTRLEKIAKKKIAFYELIAQRLAVSDEEFEGYVPNETPMDRGTRLQKYAIDRLEKETGKKIDTRLVMWTRDDNESIAVSPDGVISETEAVETKCLSSAKHIEAWLTKSMDDYEYQTLQYFAVNDKLEKMYFCFFDPRIPCKDFFYFTIERSEVQEKIDAYLSLQRKVLKDVDEVVAEMSNF